MKKPKEGKPTYIRLPDEIVQHFKGQGRGELSRFASAATIEAFAKLKKEQANE